MKKQILFIAVMALLTIGLSACLNPQPKSSVEKETVVSQEDSKKESQTTTAEEKSSKEEIQQTKNQARKDAMGAVLANTMLDNSLNVKEEIIKAYYETYGEPTTKKEKQLYNIYMETFLKAYDEIMSEAEASAESAQNNRIIESAQTSASAAAATDLTLNKAGDRDLKKDAVKDYVLYFGAPTTENDKKLLKLYTDTYIATYNASIEAVQSLEE